MPKLLTDAELSEIRAQLARRDPNVGGGYTWTTIERLLNDIDASNPERAPSAQAHHGIGQRHHREAVSGVAPLESDEVTQIMTGCGIVSVDPRYANPGTDFRL